MKARIDGGFVEYEVHGEGPTLVLLHAFPLGRFMWDPQWEALARGRRLLRFDARGFGGSDLVPGPLTMDRIADDAAALLDRIGAERAVVGGCSMGGYAAFAFARRHRERLAGLVLQDTRAGADSEEARGNRLRLAERVLAEGAVAAADAFLPRLLGETTQRERPELASQLREKILGARPESVAAALRGLAERPDSRDTLASIRVPTLVLVGEEDLLTPQAEAEAIARGIAGARLALVPRAGHLASLENPAAVNEALDAFLPRGTG